MRPQRSDDTGRTTSPIIASQHCTRNAECIHQAQEVVSERSLLTRTRSIRVAKPGRPVATQIRNNNPPPGGGERRRNYIVSMHVVREPMHQDDRSPICGAGFLVS